MILLPGDRVDRYVVLTLLGSGGMGEVYRARDPKLARDVALKLLHVDRSGDPSSGDRLLREARAVASLSHAHVLAVYDVGDVKEPERLRGLAYIAMEYVVGKPLAAYLGDESVPMAQRVQWLRDIASALGAAHDAGIIHRDVKPANVMVRNVDRVAKVLDFGIARRAQTPTDVLASTEGHYVSDVEEPAGLPTLTGQGDVVGTPFYMAPEQLRGESIDGRVDQFAWGVVAYRLLTGQAPWTGVPMAVISQILSFDPPPPCDVDPRVPVAISNVVMRTLEKHRDARFASMAAVYEALGGHASSRDAMPAVGALPSAPARDELPSGPTRPASPRAIGRRRPSVWLGAGALLALGAGALGLGVRARGKPATAPAVTSPATAPPAPSTACATNAECTSQHGGAAWHCNSRRHECVEIASADCKAYAGPHDAEASDVVWLGGMFPLHGDPGLICESRAAELARQDFASALGPSAARADDLHARPIGLVLCDEGADPLRVARHLAEDVEVPAVLGFRSTATALSVIPSVFLPDRVLSMVTISQAPMVTRIPEPPGEPRLVWRTTLDRVASTVALARFVSDVLEPAARAQPGGIGKSPMKIAVLSETEANHDFIGGLFDALQFNGKTALENGSDFRPFVVGPGSDAGADLAEELALFAPQVIIVGTERFFEDGLARVEALWDRHRPRPVYLTESTLSQLTAAFAGRDASRRRRFFAVTNATTTATNAKLVLRYNLAFPSEPVERSEAPQPSYDAFYLLAYATYALGSGEVTGPALANALGRLSPPGRAIDVGPDGVFEGFSALRSKGRIDLNGAIGSLDFDPASGEAPIDYGIVCLGVDDLGRASHAVDSGLAYDARAKKLVGALRCP